MEIAVTEGRIAKAVGPHNTGAGGRSAWLLLPGVLFLISSAAAQQPFRLPTANRALFEPGGGEKFFVGTTGKSWESGCFGCVRSEGWQMHEGLDIRCRQRDRRGEPLDPVMAAADGTVAYVNLKPSLSNYGNYIILRHRIEGLEIFSLYAHLSKVTPGLETGRAVKAGETLGIMGHTANTREPITKDRAHVHFELDFIISDRFTGWFRSTSPKERNDHGNWNGQNLLGLDPRRVFLAEQAQGDRFSLIQLIRNQTELCRVYVGKPSFSWVRRYTVLIRPNPIAEKEGIAGYEMALNFNGIPFQLIPRAASEMKSKGRFQLLSVNEAEYQKNPCRRLVTQKGSRWELTTAGNKLLDLIAYE
jgi:peptidoglycan LD-endopeptidase LytH